MQQINPSCLISYTVKMKNVRITDKIYTVPINVRFGEINNASTPNFFSGYPALRNQRIKGIAVSPQPGRLAASDPYYITLVDGKGNQLLYNWPIWDLVITSSGSNTNRLRLFDLYDIDLLSSYWINSSNVGYVVTDTLFRINFYS